MEIFINYKSLELKSKFTYCQNKNYSIFKNRWTKITTDGKINFNLFWGKSIDLRVSVLPNIYGEKCVIRILKKEEKPGELKNLWILPYNMVKIKNIFLILMEWFWLFDQLEAENQRHFFHF